MKFLMYLQFFLGLIQMVAMSLASFAVAYVSCYAAKYFKGRKGEK